MCLEIASWITDPRYGDILRGEQPWNVKADDVNRVPSGLSNLIAQLTARGYKRLPLAEHSIFGPAAVVDDRQILLALGQSAFDWQEAIAPPEYGIAYVISHPDYTRRFPMQQPSVMTAFDTFGPLILMSLWGDAKAAQYSMLYGGRPTPHVQVAVPTFDQALAVVAEFYAEPIPIRVAE